MTEKTTNTLQALVVEDDIDSLEVLTSILDSTKIIHSESSRTGESAIAYFKKNRPDITFLDIDIPAPNGIETLREIRTFDSSAKVVMVTGCSDIETVKEAISLGAFGYVVKPFVPEKILSVIKKLRE
ncbi:MAG: response regulator [Kangiellaceae bacterium]|nr:response regulator [Kangiellaceae bacterium]